MPRTTRTTVLGLTLAGALALPATASADDQSIYNSFHNSHPRFQRLRHDFDRGEQHWENSQYRDPSRAYSACIKTSRLAHRVRTKLHKKKASSPAGAKAQARVMSALDYRRRWADAERVAIRDFMRFDGYDYIRLHRDAKAYIARAQRYEAQAQKYFKRAGVHN